MNDYTQLSQPNSGNGSTAPPYPTQPWTTEASQAPPYPQQAPPYPQQAPPYPQQAPPYPQQAPSYPQQSPAQNYTASQPTVTVVAPTASQPTVAVVAPVARAGTKSNNVGRTVVIVLIVLACIGVAIGLIVWRVRPRSVISYPSVSVCSSTQFRCSNGKCIASTWKCDGTPDCIYGDDESTSICGTSGLTTYPPLTGPILFNTTKSCDPTKRFQCNDKDRGCIPLSWTCDGTNDCGDNSDEIGCECDPKTQFYCGSSKCISKTKVCDGRYDCPIDLESLRYRDEYLCSSFCSSTNFRCKNGLQCLPASWQCDGFSDCLDGSDETGCKCTVFQTKCNDGGCIDIRNWCDGFRDCRDSSDEIAECHKVCPNGGKRCLAEGFCINRLLLCDGVNDCLDGTDEKDCGLCTTNEFQCNDKRCIDKNWMCDGKSDCSNGEDEKLAECKKCTNSQFQCVSGSITCLAQSQRCDGTAQCTDASDEAQCFYNGADGAANPGDFAKPLTVTKNGQANNYICADDWSKAWSDIVCRQIGFGDSFSTSNNLAIPANGTILKLNAAIYSPSKGILPSLLNSGTCASNTVVGISCNPLECGMRAVSSNTTGPYIVNGQEAVRGAWPWQLFLEVVLSNGRASCGASLISDRWVLTAAHCVTPSVAARDVTLQAGSIYVYNTSDKEAKKLSVDRVIVHSGYTDSKARNVIINDVALLRLSQPVTFSETIRPVCVSSADVDLNKFKVCVATGWGRIRYEKKDIPTTLRQGKMKLLTTDECYAAYKSLTNGYTWAAARTDFNYFVCAGNNPPLRGVDICQGDSGGPLACQDQQNVWSLVGVSSFVFGECEMSVFARVSTFNSWITTQMSLYS